MNRFSRLDFERHPALQNPGLYGLAADLAHFPSSAAARAGFLSGSPPPLNFFANPAGDSWRSHGPIPAPAAAGIAHLAQWKFGASAALPPPASFGYAEPPCLARRGLGLRFDPYVDACLAAHAFLGNGLPADPAVLILTDYGRLSGIKLLGSKSEDWGLNETQEFLFGAATDPTSRRLYRCLAGAERPAPDSFALALVRRKLLIWNLLPFIRVAETSVGTPGLPTGWTWLTQCWEWARLFCEAVGARTIIVGPNKLLLTRGSSVAVPLGTRPVLPVDLGSDREMETIDHPFSWIGEDSFQKNCEHLKNLAPDLTDKERIFDLSE